MDKALKELTDALDRIIASDRELNEENYHREMIGTLIKQCYQAGCLEETLIEVFEEIPCSWRT